VLSPRLRHRLVITTVRLQKSTLHGHCDLRHRTRCDRHAAPERAGYVPEEPVALSWRKRRSGGSQARKFLVVEA
jgi:hypothetical protein